MWLTDWIGEFTVTLPERAPRSQIEEAKAAFQAAIAKQVAIEAERRKKEEAERRRKAEEERRRAAVEEKDVGGHGVADGIRFRRSGVPSGVRYSLASRNDPAPSEPISGGASPRWSITISDLPASVCEQGTSYKAIAGQIASSSGTERKKTFAEELVSLVSSKCKGIAPLAYKRAGLSRQAYSRIISSRHSGVDKLTAMRLCIGLKLNMEEATELLKSAGYTFSDSIPLDTIFAFCIRKRMLNINDINGIIAESGQKPFDVVL